MAEYIRKDILLEVLHEGREIMLQDSKRRTPVSLETVIDFIKELPTSDVVEVVRCKDCIFNVENMRKDPLDATDYSDITCSYFMTDGMTENDFCSYGKKVE